MTNPTNPKPFIWLMTASKRERPAKPWLQPVSYVIVGAVGAALCTTGIHWWSDFPLGVYLGYQFGMVAAHPEITGDSKPAENESSGLTFSPSFSSMGEALTLSYHF